MRSAEQFRDDVRRLRREQTQAESLLWQQLRGKRLAGAKFRRQHLIGNSIVDFCCLRSRLIIEVDGSQHAEEAEIDAARTARLEAQGYKVIRFWSHEILGNLEGMLTIIAEALREDLSGPGPDSEAESQS